MNTIHRAGLTIAGAAAVVTVGGALVVDGYMGARSAAAQATASIQTAIATPGATSAASPTPTLEPITIYVKPVPTPAVIKITRTVAAPPDVQPPRPAATQAPAVPVATPRPTYHDDGGGGDD